MNEPILIHQLSRHEDWPRRPHFDAGRFARQFGDEGHRQGWCLYQLGCKGPQTHANCSVQHFGEMPGSWPIGLGHPCFGCTEEGVGFTIPLHTQAEVKQVTPAAGHARIDPERGSSMSAGAVALAAGVAGAAVGAAAMATKKIDETESDSDQS